MNRLVIGLALLLSGCLLTIPEEAGREGGTAENGACRTSEFYLGLEEGVSISSPYASRPGARRFSVGRELAAFIGEEGVTILDVSNPPEVRVVNPQPIRFAGFNPLYVEAVGEQVVVLGLLVPEDVLGWLVLRAEETQEVVPKPLPETSDFLSHLSSTAECIYMGSSQTSYAVGVNSEATPVRLEGDFARLKVTRGGIGENGSVLVESLGPSRGCSLEALGPSAFGDLIASRSGRLWLVSGDRLRQVEPDLSLRYELDLDRDIADLYLSDEWVVMAVDRDILVFEDMDSTLEPRPLARLSLSGTALEMGPLGTNDEYVAAFVTLPPFAGPRRLALEVFRLKGGCL